MEYTRLGASGLKVSRIALGCMSFGDPSKGRPWTLDDDAAEPSSARQPSSASPSGTPPTSTARAPQRRSPAGRCASTPAGTTSSWPPRCTGRCTPAPAAVACPARPSWDRSTAHLPAWAPLPGHVSVLGVDERIFPGHRCSLAKYAAAFSGTRPPSRARGSAAPARVSVPGPACPVAAAAQTVSSGNPSPGIRAWYH